MPMSARRCVSSMRIRIGRPTNGDVALVDAVRLLACISAGVGFRSEKVCVGDQRLPSWVSSCQRWDLGDVMRCRQLPSSWVS